MFQQIPCCIYSVIHIRCIPCSSTLVLYNRFQFASYFNTGQEQCFLQTASITSWTGVKFGLAMVVWQRLWLSLPKRPCWMRKLVCKTLGFTAKGSFMSNSTYACLGNILECYWISQCCVLHSCFIFSRSWIKIWPTRLAVETVFLSLFKQLLE